MPDDMNESVQPLAIKVTQTNDIASSAENNLNQFDVFISYRTDPDQNIATALRHLIERCIEPPPKVFVAGEGGLRPSNIGYKPQIQAAVKSARAFIAVITQQSKDREWLFYEAGAAWGRDQLFVPLLIDTSPSDLASTMADYQTVKASHLEEVKGLLNSIVELFNGKLKKNFNQRYNNFLKFIKGNKEEELVKANQKEIPELTQAINLLKNGEMEKANEKFCELEKNASTNEDKAWIRISRLSNSNLTDNEFLRALESLSPELVDTDLCQYFLASLETNIAISISRYESCLQLCKASGNSVLFHEATLELVHKQFEIDDKEIAIETLRNAMVSKERDFRVRAIQTWIKLDQEASVFEQLVVLIAGLSDKPNSKFFLKRLVELSLDENWLPLLIYAALRQAGIDDTGTARNDLGRAYLASQCYSLAYLAFIEAVESGVSVAKVNIANLHLNYPIPSAGLKLLEEHTGSYDASSMEYPYNTRAGLEKSLQGEQNIADNLYEQGSQLFAKISYFAGHAVRSKKPDLKGKQIELIVGVATVNEDESDCLKLIVQNNVLLKLERIGHTIELWQGFYKGGCQVLCCFTPTEILELEANFADSKTQLRLNRCAISLTPQIEV